MRRLNVKSTMIDGLLGWLAPHYCSSCGEIGSILCDSCRYDIVSERTHGCLLCGSLTLPSGACSGCRSPLERTWHAGEHSGGLKRLIDRYKFSYAKEAHIALGDILLECLPQLPPEIKVVPVPTIRTHIRQRGYDHTLLLARHIASARRLEVERSLVRRTSSVQKGASRTNRIAQARVAFGVKSPLSPDIPYLLVDDVVTTGATIRYAAKALHQAGANTVWAAAVTRQPLDQQG